MHLGRRPARVIASISTALIRVFVLLPAIGDVNLDFIDTIGADVNKLGNVDGAIGSRGVVDQDCRTVVAVGVEMSEIHLRVWRSGLGRKYQPMSIRRETVPGIHQAGVRSSTTRRPTSRRD